MDDFNSRSHSAEQRISERLVKWESDEEMCRWFGSAMFWWGSQGRQAKGRGRAWGYDQKSNDHSSSYILIFNWEVSLSKTDS